MKIYDTFVKGSFVFLSRFGVVRFKVSKNEKKTHDFVVEKSWSHVFNF